MLYFSKSSQKSSQNKKTQNHGYGNIWLYINIF